MLIPNEMDWKHQRANISNNITARSFGSSKISKAVKWHFHTFSWNVELPLYHPLSLRLHCLQLDRQQKSSMWCYREIRFLGLRATYQARHGRLPDWLLVVCFNRPVCRQLYLIITNLTQLYKWYVLSSLHPQPADFICHFPFDRCCFTSSGGTNGHTATT